MEEWQRIGGELSAAATALDLERVATSWSMGPKTHVWKRSALLQNCSQSRRRSGAMRTMTSSQRREALREPLSLAEIAEKIKLAAEAARKT